MRSPYLEAIVLALEVDMHVAAVLRRLHVA